MKNEQATNALATKSRNAIDDVIPETVQRVIRSDISNPNYKGDAGGKANADSESILSGRIGLLRLVFAQASVRLLIH